jgi:hypothetical protein
MLAPAAEASSKDKDSNPPHSTKYASRPPSGTDSYGPLSDNGLENVDLGLLNEEIDLGGASAATLNAAANDPGIFLSPAATTASSSTAAAEAGVSTRPAARIRISVSDPVKRVSVRKVDFSFEHKNENPDDANLLNYFPP